MTKNYDNAEQMVEAMGVLFASIRAMDRNLMTIAQRQAGNDLEDILQSLIESPATIAKLADLYSKQTRIECVKTGGDVLLGAHGEYIHGDIFRAGTVMLVRGSSRTREAVFSKKHATFTDYQDWRWVEGQVNTIVAQPDGWEWHGYEGIAV